MKKQHSQSASSQVRLNRYLSMCGIASRRKADQLLLDGRVKVDGSIVTDLGSKVDPTRQRVFVDGKQVTMVHDHVYLVMNKPKDTITTLRDERGRTTVMDILKTRQRVFPIGRLDRNTTGVLLFTNDGEFANRLMHPKYEIEKSYRVSCESVVSHEQLEKLRKGVTLDDGKTRPAYIYPLPGGKGKEIGIVIHEGKNRQVRRMFESLGHVVKKLDRVAYGPITTAGLGRGESRSLTRQEVRKLQVIAGLEDA